MDALPLAVSPSAKLLLGMAERRSSGSLTLGGRTLVVERGELAVVTPGHDDPDLGAFLVASGRLSDDEVAQARNAVRQNGPLKGSLNGSLSGSLSGSLDDALDDALIARTALSKQDLHLHKRSLW